ncbi:MAG: hypothetical protein AB7P04_15080 [Bacteriovoracia bacterium]
MLTWIFLLPGFVSLAAHAGGIPECVRERMLQLSMQPPSQLYHLDHPPLGQRNLIVDSNVITAVLRVQYGRPIHEGQQTTAKALNGLSDIHRSDLRVTDRTAAEELSEIGVGQDIPVRVRGLKLNPAVRSQPAYLEVRTMLERHAVGGASGDADREIICDILFAERQPGAVPRFVTADQGIIRGMLRAQGVDLNLHPDRVNQPFYFHYRVGNRDLEMQVIPASALTDEVFELPARRPP